jgi:two-component system LytT family sensor kinase
VWLPVSLLWIGPAIFAIINVVAQRRLQGEPPAPIRELIWQGGDWFLYAFITPIIFWLSNRWPIVRPHLTRRTLIHGLMALMFCVVWAVGGKLLQAALAVYFDPDAVRSTLQGSDPGRWGRLGRDVASWIFVTLPFGVVVYASMAGLAHAIRYFDEARQREVQLTEARLSALQAQLNPHFLFNTLNTIAVRARDGDRAGTVAVVEQLAEVLRRTLSRHRSAEVTLGEELELVRLYLGIEAARFSDRLAPSLGVDPETLAVAVPSFAVQHLVENAVRHGIARRSGAGRLVVAAARRGDTLEVTVADDGPGPTNGVPFPAGHGLDNTRERLRVLHGDRAFLHLARGPAGGAVATLILPWQLRAREPDSA